VQFQKLKLPSNSNSKRPLFIATKRSGARNWSEIMELRAGARNWSEIMELRAGARNCK